MKSPVVFGKYLLLERISVGGMAEVFVAKSFGVEGFERLVAIKRILPAMAQDQDFIGMFLDEARIGTELNHSNIVHVHELGRHASSYFLAMEYISGRNLRALLEWHEQRGQRLPVAQAVFIASKVCEALDYAHRKKDARGVNLEIVHRDVSPQNILLSYEGDVKIIDFGIAKAANRHQRTEAGILKGKFGYMSPEQVEGLPIDRRSDVFAVGCVLYEMLTGERLFAGTSDFSTLDRIRTASMPSRTGPFSRVPPELQKVLMKALAKDPEERYPWASDLQEALAQFVFNKGALYTAKHLSSSLQEIFIEELEKEESRLRRFARVERPPEMDEQEEESDRAERWETPPPPMATRGPDIATVIVHELQTRTQGAPVSSPPVSSTASRGRPPSPLLESSVTHRPRIVIGEANLHGATTVGPVLEDESSDSDSSRMREKATMGLLAPRPSPPEPRARRERSGHSASSARARAAEPTPIRRKRSGVAPWLVGLVLSLIFTGVGGFWMWHRRNSESSAGLLVRVAPAEGARVSVGGEWVRHNVVTPVVPGAYEIVAINRGYQTERRTVVVAEGETQVVSLQLTPEATGGSAPVVKRPEPSTPPPIHSSVVTPRNLNSVYPPPPAMNPYIARFVTSERDVEIYLDGRYIGKTPGAQAGELKAGKTYHFVARREGYKQHRGSFLAPGDSDLEVAFRMERLEGGRSSATSAAKGEPAESAPHVDSKLKGQLACSTNPAGAEVWVNGKPTGRKTPIVLLNPLVLPVGTHEVVFKFEGKQSQPINVAIKENETAKLTNVLIGG